MVAACNAMTLLGAAVSPEDVAGEFEDNGMPLLGGALGTDPRRLPDYFAAHGVTCTPCRRDRLPGEGVFLCSYAALPLLQEVRSAHGGAAGDGGGGGGMERARRRHGACAVPGYAVLPEGQSAGGAVSTAEGIKKNRGKAAPDKKTS